MRREELVKIVKNNPFTAISTLEPDRAVLFYPTELSAYWDRTLVVYPSLSDEGLTYQVKELKLINKQPAVVSAKTETTPEDVALAIKEAVEKLAEEAEDEVLNLGILLFQSEKDEFLSSPAGMHLMNYILYDADREKIDINVAIIGKNPRLPKDYEHYFRYIQEDLPTKEDLELTAKELFGEYFKNEEDLERAVRYGIGLTEEQFISALKTSAERVSTESGELIFINPEKVKQAKEEIINRSEVLKVYHPREVDKVVGFEGAKEYVDKLLKHKDIIEVKGIFLLGVPGIGKSLFAKNLAKEVDVPTIMFNPARVFSSYVGESERKMEEALKLIDQIGEAVVYIDEIDKAVAGMGAGGRGDSGVSERVFGMFLSWLQDKNSDTFVIATANRVSHLPPEFLRAGRWNAIYFADYYPKEEHYEQLVNYYIDKIEAKGYKFPKGFKDEQVIPLLKERKFTGAEIKELIQRAVVFEAPTLKEAMKYITTSYETNPEALENIRNEASYVNAISVYDNKPVKATEKTKNKQELVQSRKRTFKF